MASTNRRSAELPPGPLDSQRRAEIVRAAAECFYEYGFDATRTQDIAERVGMLKGSLYYYIKTKDDLLFEIIDDVHEQFAKVVQGVKALDLDNLSKVWAFVYLNVLGNAENIVTSAVFAREFRALSGERRDRIVKLRDLHDRTLRDLMAKGQKEGSMRPDLNPKLASLAILTMTNALSQWYQPDGAWAPDEVAESYADLAVASMARTPADYQRSVDRARDTIAQQRGDIVPAAKA